MGHELFFNYINANQGQVESSVNFREFQKRPHHLTFSSKMPLFASVSESEVFGKHLTQHLPQQVTFFSEFRFHQVSKSSMFRKRIDAE